MLKTVPKEQRGTLMGLDEAVNTVARVAAPIVFGSFYASYGPLSCLGVAGAAVFAAAAVAAFRRFVVLRGAYA